MKFYIWNCFQISLPGANYTASKTKVSDPQLPTGEGSDSSAASKDLPPMKVCPTTSAHVFEDLESQLKPLGVYWVLDVY